MGRKSKFTEEFKAEAWRMVESGRSVDDVASDLGIGHSTLWRWVRRFRRVRDEPNAAADDALLAENKQLRKRLRELEEEREILKKAAAFFAKEGR